MHIMGVMKRHSQLALMLCFLCLEIVCLCKSDGSICRELERKALVDFKQGLEDYTGELLSSWIGLDCCSWAGVRCDNHTGHIVRIDLHNFDIIYGPQLGGEIRPSLIVLNHLRHLDLSGNYFEDNSIPAFLGSLVSLRYLNLSNARFIGHVPHQLGNLSKLCHLDLSGNSLHVIGSHWLTNLSSLQYLNLDYVDHSKATNVLKVLNTLPLISEIHLSACELHTPLSLGAHINFTNLQFLDLSSNDINSTVPLWLFQLSGLEHLDLGRNNFQDLIPLSLGAHINFTNLQFLDLSSNDINSTIPLWLFQLSGLEHLDLSYNNFQGLIPLSLGAHINFTNLHFLDLSSNDINSTVPLWLFQLSGLEYLDLSYNNFQDLIPHAIGKLTSLKVLNLRNSEDLPYYKAPSIRLPPTLGELCNLSILTLSGNNYIPSDLNGLGEIFSGCIKNSLEELYWSHAKLTGQLPSWLGNLKSLKTLDLSSNSFYGSFIQFQLPSVQKLWFARNQLNGTIPKYLGQLFPELVELDLSYNNLAGILTEAHFDNLTKLESLDMNSNSFELILRPEWVPPLELNYLDMSGCKLGPKFPSWLQNVKNIISDIIMSNTSIIDELPVWFWNFSSNIENVDLSHNEIRGKLPASSSKVTNLESLDLSYNYLEGQLPQFSSNLVDSDQAHGLFSRSTFSNTSIIVPNLSALYISSNKITGSIPKTLCKLDTLEILDLSHNMIEGVVHDCWNLSLYTLLQAMDLSHNNLSGTIPASIGYTNLEILHLSYNAFSGELPASFKNCTLLGVLDLGYNNISGSIPTWLADNSKYLEMLELRYNMLTGTIPPQLGNLSYHIVLATSVP